MDNKAFEMIVEDRYAGLYAFAFGLARSQDDASELTQETFSRLATKGSQLRDPTSVKPWLYTTLHRIFLGWKRRENRLPHLEVSTVEHELPVQLPEVFENMDAGLALDALLQLDERYRVPLMLFYIEDHSYREISDLLEISIGTVMSRLFRGKELLRKLLAVHGDAVENRIVPLNASQEARQP